MADDGESEEDPTEDGTGKSGKAKGKVGTRVTPKGKSARSGKSRVADLDDEVTVDATSKNSEVVLADIRPVGDPPMVQKHPNVDENSPPQDAMVSLNFLTDSEIALTSDFQEGQENALPPVRPPNPRPVLSF